VIHTEETIMRFWIREIMGWFLVALGLFVFYLCVVFLFNHAVIEVGPLFVIGIVVFRGGIHLLKVAVAARICLLAQEKADAGPTVAPRAPAKPRGLRSPLVKPSLAQEFRELRRTV
jgi:hypothetical protein